MIRIFISSPADVRPERLKAEQIVARLDLEFANNFHVKSVLWEREPLVATQHFQEGTPEPRGTDIVVVILWSRLGVPLPAEERFRGAVSGRLPVTGTEWEFENALAGAREQDGVPRLLLYRKTAEPEGRGRREELLERAAHLAMMEDFFARWTRSSDGQSFSAAFHPFVTTAEFEIQLYDHLRALLVERADATAERPTIWYKAPFRALLSYRYEHALIFKGRTRARNELRELLTRQIDRGIAFVLVVGASGSGKSSLVNAGLLPDVALPGMVGRTGLVRRAVMRPSDAGGDPLAALAAAILSPTALPELTGLQYALEQLAKLLRDAPAQAALPIRQGLAEAGKLADPPLTKIAEARLVVVVDQLEEIFTIDKLNQGAQEVFVVALETLARSGLVWVVATMRSDFFERLETLPSLAALSSGEARFLLLPPDEAEIGQIISQPALESGLRYEHDPATGIGLDETIQQAAARDRGALPLMSFLLDQLWQRRSESGLLTFAAYDALGKLEGAISTRAESVFQAQPQAVRRELIPLLRELVTVEGGKPASRPAPLSRFPEGTERRALVDAFLHPDARLLVADQAQLRLAHEALLTHWQRAKDQIAADARDLELRGGLERQAVAWHDARIRREKKGRLLTGFSLAEAWELLARWGAELPTEITNYIIASRHAASLRRLRQWGLAVSAPFIAALLAVLVWMGQVWWGVRQVEAEWAKEQIFVRIPEGCFNMGTPDRSSEMMNGPDIYKPERPQHPVCIKAFNLGKYSVTQGAWRRVRIFPNKPKPFYFTRPDDLVDRLPAEKVSWEDAQRFIWLISVFGKGNYRLPSEAEWEYAARANTTTLRYWGDDINKACTYENISDRRRRISWPREPEENFADCDDGYANQPAPVGCFMPNPWGLYDMLGNVTNWVEDCATPDYSGPIPTDGSANKSGSCDQRVNRGGTVYSPPISVRPSLRSFTAPNYDGSEYNGFRLVRTFPDQNIVNLKPEEPDPRCPRP